MAKILRFLCFASLVAIILGLAAMGVGDTRADIGTEKVGNSIRENRPSSATITITMTGMVGDPGDVAAAGER
jgi:hypothetical protein